MKTTPRRGFARRLTAALGVAALAAAGVLAAAVPASAAPGNMPTGTGTLTIHKYEQPSPAGGANNNGTAITVPGAWVALTGVNFTIQRITDVDLNTDAAETIAQEIGGHAHIADVSNGDQVADMVETGAWKRAVRSNLGTSSTLPRRTLTPPKLQACPEPRPSTTSSDGSTPTSS